MGVTFDWCLRMLWRVRLCCGEQSAQTFYICLESLVWSIKVPSCFLVSYLTQGPNPSCCIDCGALQRASGPQGSSTITTTTTTTCFSVSARFSHVMSLKLRSGWLCLMFYSPQVTCKVHFLCFFMPVELVALRLPDFFWDAVLVLPDGCRMSCCLRFFRPPSLSQALIFSGAPNFSALVTQSMALRMRLADVFCRLTFPLASPLMRAKRFSSYICVSAFGQVQWAEEHHCVRNFCRSRTEGIFVHALIARPLRGCFSFLAACTSSWSIILFDSFLFENWSSNDCNVSLRRLASKARSRSMSKVYIRRGGLSAQ